MTERLFAPCPRGLESALAAELAELGAHGVTATDGGVGCSGDEALIYRVNLESRLASRILLGIGECAYRTAEDIYRGARALPWPLMFERRRTIRVAVAAVRSPLPSIDFVTLRVKDAVCDAFRNATGERPDVDTRIPDVRIHVFLDASRASFYLDTSGEPLFKRGWRTSEVDAPLRENLAAGILRIAGWTPGTALLDPMCGGGTFLLEAAAASLNIAPGTQRGFGFERLSRYDAALWRTVRAAAEAKRRPALALPIYGSDRDPRAVGATRRAFQRAGLDGVATLDRADILAVEAPAAEGIMVFNPPYGVRIGEQAELAALYPRLGDRLKQRFAGWRCFVFTADTRLPKLIGLKPARRTPLFNGAIECRLYEFAIVSGSMRGRRANGPAAQ
ncbi:MAG: class I SAM-dependent RNA methyltransferase [Burkholderiales bacterium]|nr:class I SAM-dependent RNA methyltransferase [Burkholderiales bacterium]